MFRKLITNLPFNPSLLTQVAFYTKRLKQEEVVRRLGFGFMALAMFIQVFAVMAPPEKSLAYSPDYIVNSLKTRDDILRAWDGQTSDANVAKIYGRLGLTREDIAALPLNPNATIASNQADYWTIGRTSLSAVSKAGKIKQQYKNSEVPLDYGAGSVYLRQLKAWDIDNPVNYYKAFQGVKNGQKFWILVDCGNFTTVGQPPTVPVAPVSGSLRPPTSPTPPPSPGLELRKTIDGGPRSLSPGSQFTFRFEYRNPVADSRIAKNVVLTDELDLKNFEVISPPNLSISGSKLTYNIGDVPYSASFKTALTLNVKLKNDLPGGTKSCNAASLSSSNAGSAQSGGTGLCVTVINPCPLDSSIASPNDERCVNPSLVCVQTLSDLNRTTKEVTLKTTVTTSNPTLTKIQSYSYDFGDKSTKVNTSAAQSDTAKHVYKDGKYSAVVTVSYKVGSTSKEVKKITCVADVETKPDQPLTPSKSAQNITQSLSAADTTKNKANAGDVIEYTLTTHNSFSYDRANYAISDYIGDILDYAKVDRAYLNSQGGTFDEAAKTVNWAAQTVKADSDLVKKFRVTIKDPVPATNQPGTMTTSFDCVIGNKYGTEISIPINCPAVKSAEYLTKSLPNTGPGTSLAIGFFMTVVIAYFFARSRLLGKELELVRAEYATGGGF